jgi:hypothetical protein
MPQTYLRAKGFSMKSRMKLIVCLIVFSSLIFSACQGDSTEIPQGGRCGDGICDEAEQKNPSLCPGDCPVVSEGETGGISGSQSGDVSEDVNEPGEDESEPPEWVEESPCDSEEWLLTFSGCGNMINTEPSYKICMVFDACITVDRNCNISGTGNGKYKNCEYSSPTGECSYKVACSDFSIPVGGEVEVFQEGDILPSGEEVGVQGADIFKIIVDSSSVWENVVATCAGVSVPLESASATQTILGSVHRNGNGYFCSLEVPRPINTDFYGARVEGVDAIFPGLDYSFNVIMYPGCDKSPTW